MTRTVVVTGGAKGIGRATAAAFAAFRSLSRMSSAFSGS